MDLTDQIRDARSAMLLARADLDEYTKGKPDTVQFQKLFDAVQVTTAEYGRLLKEQMEKYRQYTDSWQA